MDHVPFIHVPGDNASLTAFIEGKPYPITHKHQHFETILNKLMDKDYEGLMDLISSPEDKVNAAIEAAVPDGTKDLVIKHGQAFYKGYRLDNELGRMLVQQAESGRSIPGFMNFAAKVLQSPSKSSVDELYLFLAKAQMPICEDGDFLAYKKVRNNFMDIYTGTIDNSPGQVVEMPRFAVDTDRHRTCSDGLHFCSYDYLNNFGTTSHPDARVVVVKINPADVVAIPSDYANTKGRTCRYEVISELESWEEPKLEGTDGNRWLTTDEDIDYEEEEDDDDWCSLCDMNYWDCPC